MRALTSLALQRRDGVVGNDIKNRTAKERWSHRKRYQDDCGRSVKRSVKSMGAPGRATREESEWLPANAVTSMTAAEE